MCRSRILIALLVALGGCAGARPPPSRPAPAPRAVVEEPRATREQCVALVRHLTTVMPEQMAVDPDEDVSDCLGMPIEIITCLEGVGTPTEADECVARYCAGGRGRCGSDTGPSRAGI